MKRPQTIDQEALGQHAANGEADQTAHFRAGVEAAQNGKRSFVHGIRRVEDVFAFRRQHVALGTPVEQRASNQRLQARDATCHSCMIDAQRTRRCGERAVTGQRREIPDVFPIEVICAFFIRHG